MTDENKKQVNFNADVDAYEQAKKKTDYGELSEKLRQRVNEIAYGTEVTERKRLREKLNTLRKEKRDIDKKIEDLTHTRDERQREIENVEQRLDALMETDGEYEGFLQALESDLRDGKRVDPGHGKVERAAELGECDPVDVVEALKERNPEVPDMAFRLPKPHEPANWKNGNE